MKKRVSVTSADVSGEAVPRELPKIEYEGKPCFVLTLEQYDRLTDRLEQARSAAILIARGIVEWDIDRSFEVSAYLIDTLIKDAEWTIGSDPDGSGPAF